MSYDRGVTLAQVKRGGLCGPKCVFFSQSRAPWGHSGINGCGVFSIGFLANLLCLCEKVKFNDTIILEYKGVYCCAHEDVTVLWLNGEVKIMDTMSQHF